MEVLAVNSYSSHCTVIWFIFELCCRFTKYYLNFGKFDSRFILVQEDLQKRWDRTIFWKKHKLREDNNTVVYKIKQTEIKTKTETKCVQGVQQVGKLIRPISFPKWGHKLLTRSQNCGRGEGEQQVTETAYLRNPPWGRCYLKPATLTPTEESFLRGPIIGQWI